MVDWVGVSLSAVGLIVAVFSMIFAVPGARLALRQLRERGRSEERREKRRSFQAFLSVGLVVATVNVVCSCSIRTQDTGDVPGRGTAAVLPDTLLSQLQSIRHQTSASVINNIR